MSSSNTGAIRNLLVNLVRRDLTVRYKSTVLGFFWSFIKPLVLTGIFYVAFDKILKVNLVDLPPAPGGAARGQGISALYLLTGILAWTFFVGATSEAMNVMLLNANLIKKVRLPLAVFPLGVVCSHLVHFLLAQLVLVALLIWGHLPPGPVFLLVPLVVALEFLLILAVSLILAALNVFYRDIGSLWDVLTTAWFYATPIVYPVGEAIKTLTGHNLAWLKWLYLANPLAPIVMAYRRLMLYAPLGAQIPSLPDGELLLALGLCLGVSLLLLGAAWKIFLHFAKSFADEL